MQVLISNFLRVFRPETSYAPNVSSRVEVATEIDAEIVSAETRRWILLAIGSIVIAGLLSLAVVIGRLPFISQFIDDPLWFKRCLVVHVDLALVVWFYAFIAGLISLVKKGSESAIRKGAFIVSVVGVVGMLMGGVAKGAQPVLANYIPVIDHPFFLGGLGLFFLGVIGQFVHALISSKRESASLALPAWVPSEAAIGLQASAIVVVLAGATWISTTAGMPGNLDIETHFEFSVWGAGHVLQVANVAAMLAVWMWLMKRATGQSLFAPRQANMVFGTLIAPHFIMPILTLRGPLDTIYHSGATFLMRWCIFPVTLFVLIRGVQHLQRHRAGISTWTQKMARSGFYASAGLTLFGFILGACIRSSTTLVPAHYHASLGGITAAFMAAAYLILADIAERKTGDSLGKRFWQSCKRQLAVFGVGQLVFVLGFAIGGVYGLGRKTYASEQTARSLGEFTGLTVMGVGGILAAVGGVWFLVLALKRIFAWRASSAISS
jgi:cytochrome c oxidase subunit I